MVLLAGILTGISLLACIEHKLYFALNFPECKSCGWLTKENGRCCGCHAPRKRRWQ